MGIFRGNTAGQARYAGTLHNLQFTESVFGTCVPIVFGTPRVHGKLLFYGGFKAVKAKNSSGKGIFGGKATQFIYYADNLQCLAQGCASDKCKGILNIWDQNGRFANQFSNYNYLIDSSLQVQPTISPMINADLGVYHPVSYSLKATNYKSGGPVTFSGTQNVPFQNVAYPPGASGQYSFDPNTSTYYFHASDVGKSIHIIYSTVFSLYYEQVTQAVQIPTVAPYQVSSDNQAYYYSDQGVVFVNDGTALIRDGDSTSPPSGPGHYNQHQGVYTFHSADFGKSVYMRYTYTSQDAELTNTSKVNLTFFPGSPSPAPWSYMSSKYPGQNLGYNSMCYVGFNPMYLGGSAQLQPYNYEMSGLALFGAGFLDAHPCDALMMLLTDPLIGVGFPITSLDGLLPFTVDCNDGTSGGWPVPLVPVTGQNFSGALKVNTRDTVYSAGVSTIGGTKIFVSGWLNSLGLTGHPSDGYPWTLAIGVSCLDALGNPYWVTTPKLKIPPGLDWTYVCDYITIPNNVVSIDGWIQIDAATISTFTGLVSQPTFSTLIPDSWKDAYAYWAANYYFFSKAIDTQSSVAEIFDSIIQVGNVGAVFSEGTLKLVPYGDTTCIGNGFIYNPPSTPAAVLTWDDLLMAGDPGTTSSEDIIQVAQKAPQDCMNYVQAQFTNRINDYNNEIVPEQNDAFIATYGFRPEAPQTWDWIMTHYTATWALNLRLKRNCYIRNTPIKFALPFYFTQLEPMDLVVLPTGEPVRITQIEEDKDGKLSVEAEQWSYGTSNVTVYPKQQSTSFLPILSQSLPGNTSPVIFEATPQSVLARPNTLQIAVAGDQEQWGGCEIFVSMDNSEYVSVGKMDSMGRNGLVSQQLGIGSDPDTTETLSVDMAISQAEVVPVTQAQADQFTSLCALTNAGGLVELISYENATETAINRYDITYLRRGVYGTTIGTWYPGDKFSYIGIYGIFEYQYPSQFVGKTIWFKFASYNIAHLQEQDISVCKAWPYVIQGTSLQPVSGGTFHTDPPIVLSAQATTTVPSVVGLVGSVTSYAYDDSPHSGPVASYIWKNPSDGGTGIARTISSALRTVTGTSLMFDLNYSSYGGHGGPADPVQWMTLNNAGAVTGSIPLFLSPPSDGYDNFNVCTVATLSIPAAGTYNFTVKYKDQIMIGLGGGATVSTGYRVGYAGQTMSVVNGSPLVFVGVIDGSGGNHTANLSFTFPAAGNYAIEIDWVYWFHSQRTMTFTLGSGTNIPPVPTSGGTQGQISILNFVAMLNNQQIACTPTPNIIQNLTRGSAYYVYYIDPAFAGGNVVPYATQNVQDFLNLTGYHQLLGPNADGSVTIPMTVGGVLRGSPTQNLLRMFLTFSVGSTTAITAPAQAFDGNTQSFCLLRGFTQDPDVFFCEVQWWGPASKTVAYNIALYIDVEMTSGDTWLELEDDKGQRQVINGPLTRQIITMPILSNVDLGQCALIAHAGGTAGQPPAEVKVYDLYFQ